jgi:hypothetical protein
MERLKCGLGSLCVSFERGTGRVFGGGVGVGVLGLLLLGSGWVLV